MIKYKMLIIAIVLFFFGSALNAQEIGTIIPDFKANNQDGELWSSKDFKQKKYLVVYFILQL